MQELLKYTEVADRLRVTRATVYQIIARDPTFPRPFHVTPHAPRFRKEEVEAWLEQRTAA